MNRGVFQEICIEYFVKLELAGGSDLAGKEGFAIRYQGDPTGHPNSLWDQDVAGQTGSAAHQNFG